ncbi:RNA-dependent RNA polymerase [Erysiphe necator mitovirus 2]|uniref:RNA-dependent RNA polymerase n=1 Tax=Erysiphe necator mitovirus 2 TaxID=2052562 RepID=UPI000CD33ABA|nr:RNA-dependent RNA polymerase [Erysiphe necator mitovirus 2]ATS94399.1 RNA-dependent RNA polymerase [Erysiphe necator mitovirus 2]
MLWTGRSYFPSIPEELLQESVRKLETDFENNLSRGRVAVSDKFKAYRLSLTRYVSGSPIRLEGIVQDRNLLPTVLPVDLRRLIVNRDLNAIRWALTLFTISRTVMGGKPVNYDDIVRPGPHPDQIHTEISDYDVVQFWQRLGRPKIDWKWKNFHWSTKSGPNGPALQGALADLKCLTPDLIQAIDSFMPVKNPLTTLLELKDSPLVAHWYQVFKVKSRGKLRKLSIKDDREAKSRVFAILDYWSQTALQELHKGAFKLLRRLPRDCTYDQGKLLSELANKKTDHQYYSFDLSSATDRFPLDIQERFVRLLTNKDVAKSWRKILVGEEYVAPNGLSYKYGCGQPMGAHSSWPIFTLCHHMVVFVAARNCGIKRFYDYAILGDDIVISHDQVAAEYKRIISALGVELSEAKSHVSKDTFEFAKRWFHKSVEISPFPLHGLISTLKSWPQLMELLINEVPKRGYRSILDFSPGLNSFVDLFPSIRMGKTILKRIELNLHLPYMWTSEEGDVNERCQPLFTYAPSMSHWPNDQLFSTLTKCASMIARRDLGKAISDVSRTLDRLWSDLTSSLESSAVDQSASLAPSFVDNIPMIKVLKDLSDPDTQFLGSVPLGKLTQGWDVWKAWRNIDLLNIPKLNGILPMRALERKVNSRAHLSLRLMQYVTKLPYQQIIEELTAYDAPRVRKRRPRS